MRPFLYSVVFYVMATACLAQPEATPPANSDETRAVFERLKSFIGKNSLDFKTSFVAQSRTRPTRGTVHFLIKRPNSFRIEGASGISGFALVSNGKVMTIYNAEEHRFTEVPAPDTPADAMALLVGLAATQSQVLKLLGVLGDVAAGTPGTKVTAKGSDAVDGRQCSHFSIVENADSWYPEQWEVWLEQKDTSRPCKFKVTNTDSLTRDVQTNQVTSNPDPTFSDDTFEFTPPKGSEKVQSVGALGLRPPTQ
jgi:outer membrane lipoprotein-sorting protein